ncbi:hypothetical protein FQR65_LT02508 [Abscondita terminalis]|nr:hypothetical protein FQR65_LT02508 [Abscondita terminalis]
MMEQLREGFAKRGRENPDIRPSRVAALGKSTKQEVFNFMQQQTRINLQEKLDLVVNYQYCESKQIR